MIKKQDYAWKPNTNQGNLYFYSSTESDSYREGDKKATKKYGFRDNEIVSPENSNVKRLQA